MDTRISSPSEDELTGTEQNRSQHHGGQPLLRNSPISCSVIILIVNRLIVNIESASDDCSEKDGKEGQSGHERFPASKFTKDDGDRAELHIQDAVAETGVEGH